MYIQLLTNIDWVGVGVGFAASATLFGVISAVRRKQYLQRLNTKDQELASLQTQLNDKHAHTTTLLDKHTRLEQEYQEQRDEAQRAVQASQAGPSGQSGGSVRTGRPGGLL